MFVVGLAGPPWSGKTHVVARHLVANYGAWRYTGSDSFGAILQEQGLPRERTNYSNLSMAMRKRLGDRCVLDMMLRAIEELPERPKLVLHDGIRWPKVVPMHHAEFPHFRLVYVTANLGTRYNRAISKGGKDGRPAITSIEQFIVEENLESEREIPELEPLADEVISTEIRSEDETRAAVDGLMARWRAEGLI